MQTQDAPVEILFKFWPWLEANKNRLIAGVAALFAVYGIYSFLTWQHEQKEAEAGNALTKLLVAPAPGAKPEDQAAKYAQLAAEYSGTAAAKRAQLQAATAFFEAGRYDEATAQFQKFLAAGAPGALAATAQLGLAASQEALGKPEATASYQKVVSLYPGSSCEQSAKAALARLQKPAVKP